MNTQQADFYDQCGVVRGFGHLIIIACFFPAPSLALEISSSLNPVGAGARANAMGGAFLAFADDATATSWNPAGLTQLRKPEISIVGGYFGKKQEYYSNIFPEIESEQVFDSTDVNFASISSPVEYFSPLKYLTFSFSYQKLYELERSVNYKFSRDLSNGVGEESISFEQDGKIDTLSLAISYKFGSSLSLGASINDWASDRFSSEWSSRYRSEIVSTSEQDVTKLTTVESNSISLSGRNYNIGGLWKVYERESKSLSVGLIYKTSFDASLLAYESLDITSTNTIGTTSRFIQTTKRHKLTMPPVVGVGFAYRYSDSLLVSFDTYKSYWSKHVLVSSDGSRLNPLDLSPLTEGELHDTIQTRAGLEKVFIKSNYLLSIRSGIFYDPQSNIESTDEYYGIGIGIGYTTKNFSLDIATRARYGKAVSSDLYSLEDSRMDVFQIDLMFSFIKYL